MSNPIKYSTGSETLALKKGNFYIGTGDVGKGPTSETGYYNGITPPSGGYTIYLNKASGGPSICTASNDAQLISLTNSIAGQSYTGVQQCFDYFYGQTDKLLVNQDYPADYPYIVMDGLVLNLDAGITQSYPGSGTTWTDINGLGPKNNGTLINGPTFSGGSIAFDGTDKWVGVQYNPSLGLSSQGTLSVWCYPNTLNQELFAGLIGMTTGGKLNQQSYYLHWRDEDDVISAGIQNLGTYNTINTPKPTVIGWYCFVFTWNGSSLNLYQNGTSVSTPVNQTISAQNLSSDIRIGGRMFYPDAPGNGEFKGKISNTQIYNRALTASEVLQNFNAQKGRFGL
jgi:hypothetical protein